MKVKQIVEAGWQNQKEFLSRLKVKKKLSEYASQNDITQLYSIVHETYEPVFVLSTGRCGTAFLTQLLNAERSFHSFHEPSPEFFYHTLMAYKEYQSDSEKVKAVFDVARYELIRDTYISGKRYVETNNRITFFAHQIAALYPKAKFIHLVRNPASVIKSGIGRSWYTSHSLYDEGRVFSSDPQWKSFSQIEKIGWLWSETNSFIEKFKEKQPSSRCLTVRAENLFKELNVQKEVFDFLGVKVPTDSVLKKWNGKANEGKPTVLTTEQKKEIELVVNGISVKDKYGY